MKPSAPNIAAMGLVILLAWWLLGSRDPLVAGDRVECLWFKAPPGESNVARIKRTRLVADPVVKGDKGPATYTMKYIIEFPSHKRGDPWPTVTRDMIRRARCPKDMTEGHLGSRGQK